RLRHEWVQSAGRFRHALLGPVQGLTSAARMLTVLAEEAGVDAQALQRCKARVDEEAEIIRLWRKNQRLYQSTKVEIQPRAQALRPLVARCLDRYQSPLDARDIALQLRWEAKGSVVFPFDENAIDLALSNLLDNARKYSFFHQTV